jgi:hypothetical protein
VNLLDDPLTWLHSQPQAARASADPARWRVLEALARRAAGQAPGSALRALLAAKLEARCSAWPEAQSPAASTAASTARPNPLAELLKALPAQSELRAQSLHRRSFTRWRTARQLASLQAAPSQPVGPLNAMALLPRALAALQAASPEYLQRLLAYVGALEALVPSKPGAGEVTTSKGSRSKGRAKGA